MQFTRLPGTPTLLLKRLEMLVTFLGLEKVYVFFKIELPLIIPVLLAGPKVSLVQTSAGTILAALVGAGGLGIFIFPDLAQTA
jgi:osmoprotectant transport system permease protein